LADEDPGESGMKSYANAFSFRRALEDRLAAAARSEGADLQRLRRQVAFDRLLVRLFSDGSPPWCLKGGYALELKLSMARSTKDLDLGLTADVLAADDLLETLQEAASRESGDFFVFAIGEPIMDLDGAPYGGSRYPVEANLDGRLFARFHLDVGMGDVQREPFEWIEALSTSLSPRLTGAPLRDLSSWKNLALATLRDQRTLHPNLSIALDA
jgi:hypothetical protein